MDREEFEYWLDKTNSAETFSDEIRNIEYIQSIVCTNYEEACILYSVLKARKPYVEEKARLRLESLEKETQRINKLIDRLDNDKKGIIWDFIKRSFLKF